MGVNDDILGSLSSHLVDLDRFDNNISERVVAILLDAEEAIIAQLRLINPTSPKALTHRVARLSKLLENVRGTLETAYDSVIDTTHLGLREAAKFEFAFAQKTVSKALAPLSDFVDVHTVTVSPGIYKRLAEETLVDLGDINGAAYVRDWIGGQKPATINAITTQLQQGILQGDGMAEIVRRVKGGGVHKGVMEISRNWATSMVRTSVTAIVEQARGDTFRANKETLKGVYQVTTLDERTTPICLAYSGRGWVWGPDGEEIPVGHSLGYHGGTPRHVKCRSLDNPWVKSWQEMGLEEDELPARLRERFDGKIPAKLDAEKRFKKASDPLQNKILGKGKAQLWRDGKVTLEDLIDKNGGARTLKDTLARLAS